MALLRRMLGLLTRRRLTVFFVALIGTYLVEHVAENWLGLHEGSIFNAPVVYRYLLTSWPRTFAPRFTSLVVIDGEADGAAVTLAHKCEQREYLSRLLTAVAAQAPNVIVIDKYLEPDKRCGKQEEVLNQTVAKIADRIPVVTGIRILNKEPPIHIAGTTTYKIARPLVLTPVRFLRFGIINVDTDNRRLPLGWQVIEPSTEKIGQFRPSLALQAALAREPDLLNSNPRLRSSMTRRESPYISVIPPDQFKSYLAKDVPCVAPADESIQTGCDPFSAKAKLRGMIVVVGESFPGFDRHESPVGEIYGMYLQANYIEAALDDRLFSPAPAWVNYIVGFAFFVAFELVLLTRRVWQCLLAASAALLVMFLLLAIVSRNFGIYINPVAFSSMVVVLNLVHWFREHFANHISVSPEGEQYAG